MGYEIDQDRTVMLYGSITRDLSAMSKHPMHEIATKLAGETGNSAFTRLADPVRNAAIEIPAKDFLEWLEASGLSTEFLRDLQCMAQTDKGEPLLTSWVSWRRFWGAVAGSETPIAVTIKLQVEQWQGHGLDEVYFDFYTKADFCAGSFPALNPTAKGDRVCSMEVLRAILLENPDFHLEYHMDLVEEYRVTRKEARDLSKPYPKGYWKPLARVDFDFCEQAIKDGLLVESEEFCSCYELGGK